MDDVYIIVMVTEEIPIYVGESIQDQIIEKFKPFLTLTDDDAIRYILLEHYHIGGKVMMEYQMLNFYKFLKKYLREDYELHGDDINVAILGCLGHGGWAKEYLFYIRTNRMIKRGIYG